MDVDVDRDVDRDEVVDKADESLDVDVMGPWNKDTKFILSSPSCPIPE